jgi:hypothetical protein
VLREYPRVANYIKRLPRGLDSYPQCKSKASLYRTALQSRPLVGLEGGALPEPITALVRQPLLMSSWMDTPKAMALVLAISDHYRMTEEQHLTWTRELGEALFASRAYRMALSLASPVLLLRGIHLRFGAFHQGVTLELTDVAEKSACLIMRFPTFLFDPLLVRGFAVSYQVALSHSRARDAEVLTQEIGDRHARFLGTWE